jgi:hypothetical protein
MVLKLPALKFKCCMMGYPDRLQHTEEFERIDKHFFNGPLNLELYSHCSRKLYYNLIYIFIRLKNLFLHNVARTIKRLTISKLKTVWCTKIHSKNSYFNDCNQSKYKISTILLIMAKYFTYLQTEI